MSKLRARLLFNAATALFAFLLPAIAHAAEGAPHVDGKGLGLVWVLPFAGMLLSIAVMPLAVPNFWHHHFGKVAAFWSLLLIVPFAITQGFGVALYEVMHTLILEYTPFILLLFALFTVAGGVRIKGNLRGSPALNTGFLAVGTVAAGWMGTTGASMLLIRPMLRANDNRRHNVHVVVFFIFLVANIGGSMTPLGDPPLFLGFLKGVDFFWPTINLAAPTLVCALILLAVFYAYDTYLFRKEGVKFPDPTPDTPFGIEGGVNILLLGGIVFAVLLSGVWKSGITLTVYHVEIELQNVVRDILLVAVALLSLKLTSKESRIANGFSWGPILEVAKLFIGIFLTIIPAIAILRAGSEGSLSSVVSLVTRPDGAPDNAMYFWITGILSSFLDNAPTYLIFFNTAGGDAAQLMGPLGGTLLAISAGAVFMGANTYIGNAPNFMVKSIAEEAGVKMPSFFGYMAWSCAILVPLFVLVTLVFF
jgi:Na+/H+ antiporter NhaD/arsenite permease-like protein